MPSAFKRFRKPTAPGDESAVMVKVYVPMSLYNILKAKSMEYELPIRRLIAYAIDNEITSSGDSFDYPCPWSENVFVDGAYAIEAGKVLAYLDKFGAKSVDQLIMARRDIGVLEKDVMMLAIRELLAKTSLVEKVRPKFKPMEYPRDYFLIKPKTKDNKKLKRIADLEKELLRLKGREETDE